MNRADRVFVAGHRGLAGSAIVRELQRQGFENLLLRNRDEVDLTDDAAVKALFESERPDVVINAAGKVGGILANDRYPADFIRDNLRMQTNLIDHAWRVGVKKFVFLGSSCIYPRLAAQPITEDALLTGPLEGTNEWYAIAKIAGIKMCQAYRRQYGFDAICLMPTNLYGPGDTFDLENSHVLPTFIRKFHEARSSGASTVEIWGTGEPRREFLYVDDLASAVVHLADCYSDEGIVNVGVGEDIRIMDLARLVGDVVGFGGELVLDRTKPDGTPRKLLDVSRITGTGWAPRWNLRDGIAETYRWFTAEGHAGAAL